MIVATALLHDLPLISRNRKDVAAIEGLSLINPFHPPALSRSPAPMALSNRDRHRKALDHGNCL